MRWRGRDKSKNVEDRRGKGGGLRFPFPGGGDRGSGLPGRGVRFPAPRGGGGIGVIGLLIIVVVMLMLGVDPRVLLEGGGPATVGERQVQEAPLSAEDREKGDFVAVVLRTTENFWSETFAASGRSYAEPALVLFRGQTGSACGAGLAQMGPFYCPLDQKVYIDLSFFDDLHNRFGAPGDFAQAYVIAHEIGHHVQTLLGITQKVMQAKAQSGAREGNAIQVRMELQADCFAGLWANYAQSELKILDPGDIEEALHAAAAIGDDRIQRRTQGYVVPDAFTHGSSEQRVTWFRRGFESGRYEACDTFGGRL